MQTPPPLVLPEFLFLSQRNAVRPASSMAASGMSEFSHVSVISRMQQSFMRLFVEICSCNSSILLAMDLALVRNTLGRGGLIGCFFSLANRPDRHPRFCFLSLLRLCRLATPKTIHGEPGVLAIYIRYVV